MPQLILFNKPYNVLSQFRETDAGGSLATFIPLPGFYPAGRLDKDSEGLLVLTDDGRMQQRITDPRFKLEKSYLVQVEGIIDEAALRALRTGVQLREGLTLPAQASRISEPALWPRDPPIRFRANIPTSWIRLTIREGRNRQVRRMTAATGFPTLRLVRWSIGDWSVAGLAPGQFRLLTVTAPVAGARRKPLQRPRR